MCLWEPAAASKQATCDAMCFNEGFAQVHNKPVRHLARKLPPGSGSLYSLSQCREGIFIGVHPCKSKPLGNLSPTK